MKVKRYTAPEGAPLPFFTKDMERCEIVTSFFKDLGRDPTIEEHCDAWQHVKMCFPCLRNVARLLFQAADGGMPLPLFVGDRKDEILPNVPHGQQHAKAN